jgi:biotin transport system ATP-binding protein
MIVFDKLQYSIAGRAILREVDLVLTERRIGIVGSNGSGKSTLVRMINALLRPTKGAVRVLGADTRTEGAAIRRKVGFVFQNPDHQIVMPLVAEDLAFGLRRAGLTRAEVASRVDAALERFGFADRRDQPAHDLSGGEKQLLAVAGVLVTEPEIVVFDEPTTLLDLRNRRRIARLIDELAQPAIVVSHDLDLLGAFDRVLVIDEGRVVADGPPGATIASYVERAG